MNIIKFEFKGKQHICKAPSTWNEVSQEQLLLWIGVLYSKLSEEEKLAMAVPIFYGLNREMLMSIKPHQRMLIAPTLRGLFKLNNLNKWLMPNMRHWFRVFHGPADKFSNMTAHEFFSVCEPIYWQYKKSNETSLLNSLCAVLYRPKRKGLVDDDIREEITDAGIARRAKRFAKFNIYLKLAILFNYEGCRNFITSRHPRVFENKEGQSKKRGDVTLALAGGPLGNHQETKRTNLYTFLLHLTNLIEQEENLKNKNR